ncbi:MAG TPA: FAD-binding protein [Verrucomicrobiae bacterium]|nr:FAD-binding protein [Verrucomicrobiae bacterium]
MANRIDTWESVEGSVLTTMGVGGLVRVSRPASAEELENDIKTAGEQGIPYRILGAGSDVLLPDEGFGGLLIIPANKTLEVLPDAHFSEAPLPTQNERYRREEGKGYLELEKIHLPEGEAVWVRVGAGVPWGQLVMWTLQQNLVGLQWFARIPCAAGGAVFNNIHGEKHFFSEVVQQVTSYSPRDGWVTRLPSALGFAYDYSVFHDHPEEAIWDIVIKLQRVSLEEAGKAKDLYITWTKAKTIAQPSGANSGSVFQNVSAFDEVVKETGMVAAGWYVEHAGCRGWEEGGLQVYPSHGNFIINKGMGTQKDFIRLVERVRNRVHEVYGIWLAPEVICFDAEGKNHQW